MLGDLPLYAPMIALVAVGLIRGARCAAPRNATNGRDAVLIGMGACVLNDCRIGEGSIIAAGAVIPEHTVIPPM